MSDLLVPICVALAVLILIAQIVTLFRQRPVDLSRIDAAFVASNQILERQERSLREELAQSRSSSADESRKARSEMTANLQKVGNALLKQILAIGVKTDKGHSDMQSTIDVRLGSVEKSSATRLLLMRQEAAETSKSARLEVTDALAKFNQSINTDLSEIGNIQRGHFLEVIDQIGKLTEANSSRLEAYRNTIDERLRQIHTDSASSGKLSRDEITASLKNFGEASAKGLSEMSVRQKDEMESLRKAVEERLKGIQDDNAKQLEQMRQTVDEKLQGTLETRLGESFKLVSDRLEQVHKGLGEMQSLASGVGDLKKVLTNVKSRGTWGEVQLAALLEQVLTPDQFATNVATKGGGERVEFAIRLPGKSSDPTQVVWLPIDAKFPTEDYQRLVEAQDRADFEGSESAGKQLENRIKSCAKDICNKYLNPPQTTDFAILFLPTEGLFAEVVRRIGVTEVVQRESRVVIAGPSTLWSLLNSLQMGFRTLAIEKRSSEVWNLLAAVKTEWAKYGDVLDKVQKKLEQASNTIETAQVRSRAIERRLRLVEELPEKDAQAVLAFPAVEIDDEVETA